PRVTRAATGTMVVDGAITADHITVSTLAAIQAELGSAVISTTGHLRSGQTGFNTGTGWFIGHVGGNPVASFGNPSGSRFTFNGGTGLIELIGNIKFADGIVQSFTPTWTGFGVGDEPSGDLYYANLGTHAMLWVGGSNLTGVSNSTSMSVTNVPSAIRPQQNLNIGPVLGIDGSAGSNQIAWAYLTSAGVLTFNRIIT